MSPLRLTGSTSGYSQLDAPAVAGDQTFTLPSTGGTLDRLNRAGNVLQVVHASYTTLTANNTSTYADTGLTATITPTSASSKILVIVNQCGVGKSGDTRAAFRLMRGSTNILFIDTVSSYTASAANNYIGSVSASYLDSPSSTSAITYKTQFSSVSNIAGVYCQNYSGSEISTSTITLMEVAA